MTATIFCVGGAGCEIGKSMWVGLPENVRNGVKHLVFIDSDIKEVGLLDDPGQGKLFDWMESAPSRDRIEMFNISIRSSRENLTGLFKRFINNPREMEEIDPRLREVMKIKEWKEWMEEDYANLFISGYGGVGRRRSASFALFMFAFFRNVRNYNRLVEIITNDPGEIIILASFGGGTGSGCHLHLARLIKFIRGGQGNTHFIGILPHLDEGETEKANALHALVEHVYLGKKPCDGEWYDGNPFTFVFLFDGNTFYDEYGIDNWPHYIDLAITNFIHNFLLSGSNFANFEGFNVLQRIKQCEEDGSFFVSVGSHIIEYPMEEVCRVIDTGVETMRMVEELNNIEKRICGILDLRSTFNEHVKKKYKMEIEPEYRSNEVLARIRAYVERVAIGEMKVVEDSANLMKIYRGGNEAEIKKLGELTCDYIEKIKGLHEKLAGFSLEAMEKFVNKEKGEFEKSFKDRTSIFGDLSVKIAMLSGIISNFYENILSSIRLSMLKSELEGISVKLSVEQLFSRQITKEASEMLLNGLKSSIDNVIKLIDSFVDFITSDLSAKSSKYEDVRKSSLSYENPYEDEINDVLKLIEQYLRAPILKQITSKIFGDPELEKIKDSLSEKVGTVKRKTLRRIKKDARYIRKGIFDSISSLLKELRELLPPHEYKEAGKPTYKGLLKEIAKAIREFKNVKGRSSLIETKIVPSDKLKGYVLMQKLLGENVMEFVRKPSVIESEDQFHITRVHPAKNLWEVHTHELEIEERREKVNAACSCVWGNEYIHLGEPISEVQGIFIPNWEPLATVVDLQEAQSDDLWKINFSTLYYFLKAEDFHIFRWLCELREGEWKWHERYSILIERGEDKVKPVKEEINRLCSSV